MKQGKPSSTARLIARSIILVSSECIADSLFYPSMIELSRLFTDEFTKGKDRMIYFFQFKIIRKLIWVLESLILPGIFLHYTLRKKQIKIFAEKCIDEGFEQFIILGAGYDSLGIYLKEIFPHLHCVEIGFADTQQVKVNALKNSQRLHHVEFVGHNLENPDPAIFHYGNIDINKPTVLIAEGLFMYFSEEDVKNIFNIIRITFQNKTKIIFTFLEPDKSGKANFHRNNFLISWWLKLKGENFRWGQTKNEIPLFLEQLSFHCLAIVDPEETEKQALLQFTHNPDKIKIGEFICLAENSAKEGR